MFSFESSWAPSPANFSWLPFLRNALEEGAPRGQHCLILPWRQVESHVSPGGSRGESMVIASLHVG